MKKFIVKTWEAEWYSCEYVVEAENESDIKGMTYEELQECPKVKNFDQVDDYDITNITPYED